MRKRSKRPIPTDPDALLTEAEVSELSSYSKRTLQSWRTKRRGPPCVHHGRSVRYRRGTVIEWMNNNSGT